MRTFAFTLVALALVLGIPPLGFQGEELNRLPIKIDKSVRPLIEEIATGPAFSFVYDGKRSQDLLPHPTATQVQTAELREPAVDSESHGKTRNAGRTTRACACRSRFETWSSANQIWTSRCYT